MLCLKVGSKRSFKMKEGILGERLSAPSCLGLFSSLLADLLECVDLGLRELHGSHERVMVRVLPVPAFFSFQVN